MPIIHRTCNKCGTVEVYINNDYVFCSICHRKICLTKFNPGDMRVMHNFNRMNRVYVAWRKCNSCTWTYEPTRALYTRSDVSLAVEYASKIGPGFVICIGQKERVTFQSFLDNGTGGTSVIRISKADKFPPVV